MPGSSPRISVRVSKEVLAALEKRAADEGRSLSNLVQKALADLVRAKGRR